MSAPATDRPLRLVAVDLGASSGRVVVATVGPAELTLTEVHRFGNGPVQVNGRLHWDILGIYREVLTGLRAAAAVGAVDGIGIDSWAIDYGLLDGDGHLIGNPVSHRDARTDGVRERVCAQVGEERLYAVTGLQQLPFSTLYQLCTEGARLEAADRLLLLPDLLGFWLTGVARTERTNASTTQLYDVRERAWATDLAQEVGLPARILPELIDPGSALGTVLPQVCAEVGLDAGVPVITVGSHDTASAVVAVPLEDRARAAYISSGTWSLVGVELEEPVLTPAAREADFTNEGGIDATVRFLRNVSGLWVLSESLRTWSLRGQEVDLATLLAEAADEPAMRSVVDLEHADFLPPGDMPARLAEHCRASGQPVPASPAGVARCIVDSLAEGYRRTLAQATELTGVTVEVVHLVGGGARNELLCQTTADVCGLPVVAGPIEASALGNVLVQARALGADLPDLAAMRGLLRRTQTLVRYEPRQVEADSAQV